MTLDPESAGLDARHLSGIGAAVRNGRLRNLHGVAVMQRGYLVFEVRVAGERLEQRALDRRRVALRDGERPPVAVLTQFVLPALAIGPRG